MWGQRVHSIAFVFTTEILWHGAGFNCAEAVNFGPPDWLPYGTDRAQKYRKDWKPLTLSHDALLVTLVTAARPAAAAAKARGQDLSAASLPPHSVAAGPVPSKVTITESSSRAMYTLLAHKGLRVHRCKSCLFSNACMNGPCQQRIMSTDEHATTI